MNNKHKGIYYHQAVGKQGRESHRMPLKNNRKNEIPTKHEKNMNNRMEECH